MKTVDGLDKGTPLKVKSFLTGIMRLTPLCVAFILESVVCRIIEVVFLIFMRTYTFSIVMTTQKYDLHVERQQASLVSAKGHGKSGTSIA